MHDWLGFDLVFLLVSRKLNKPKTLLNTSYRKQDFQWIGPLICVCVCLWKFKTPSFGGPQEFWSNDVSLILDCYDNFFVSILAIKKWPKKIGERNFGENKYFSQKKNRAVKFGFSNKIFKKNCISATIRARQEIQCQFQLDLYMNIHLKKISKMFLFSYAYSIRSLKQYYQNSINVLHTSLLSSNSRALTLNLSKHI